MAEHFNRNSFSIILGLSHVLLLVPSTQGEGGGSIVCLRHSTAPHDWIKPRPLFRFTFIKELKDSCFDAYRDIISNFLFLRMNGKLSKHP